MKQLMQDLANGTTSLVEAPKPQVPDGHLLIDTKLSLISTGTEKMLVDFGRSGLLTKAKTQPDKVAQVLAKAKTDGIVETAKAVRSKLNQLIPLGYSNVGVVKESRASGFSVGDRVVSNGPHADVVVVPEKLCAKIPECVSDEDASFVVVASIGLQGIRLAKPSLGEMFVVIGVGLIGLLTVQLLVAQGCRVLAIDLDQEKLTLAKSFGAEICNLTSDKDPVSAAMNFSRGEGVDGVIITASTKSNDPVTQAAKISRKRGRIILVGVTGLKLNRSDFYEKELKFQVSCSYGPGRYDPSYEEKGNDYPFAFVRWTEQRNFVAVLDLLAKKRLDVTPLITLQQPFEKAPYAYDMLASGSKDLGIILTYDHSVESRHLNLVNLSAGLINTSAGSVLGCIGAGNYASRVLIPAFNSCGASLHTIASAGGINSVVHGKRLGFQLASSDPFAIVSSDEINTVVIATRHNTHAEFTVKALNSGKHVFVEKPLALTINELNLIQEAQSKSSSLLMVGFNRRFSPLVQKMKKLLNNVSDPKSIIMVMNAGEVAGDHWTQDLLVGGGRLIGEACHHIDLARYLIGSPITSIQSKKIVQTNSALDVEDKFVLILGFYDGSFCTIHYLANGARTFPKERIEVFASNRTLQLDNFLKLRGYNWPGFKKQSLWRQDKGQMSCVREFIKSIEKAGIPPIPINELFEVARVSIEASDQIRAQL